MKLFWKDMEIREFETPADFDFAGWIGVLPLAATEQHGPHLPLETDSLIATGVVNRLAKRLPETAKVTFLPVEEIGYSPEHMDYPGSKSLSYYDAIERWINKGEYLNSHGIDKMILLNAHGGNSPLMTIVASELRLRLSMLVVTTSWTRFGTPSGLISRNERAFGIHGGEMETSAMLALHPELVDLEKLENFTSFQERLANENEFLRAYGKHAYGWKMQDLNPLGVVGNAAGATAKKGDRLLDHCVEGLMQLIEEVERFDIGHLDEADRLNDRNLK